LGKTIEVGGGAVKGIMPNWAYELVEKESSSLIPIKKIFNRYPDKARARATRGKGGKSSSNAVSSAQRTFLEKGKGHKLAVAMQGGGKEAFKIECRPV